MNTNEKKSAQLGMPHGTANHKLRKMILFHLITKYNENVCFQCGKIIESVEELSIEHKIPWLGNDTNLFWDLDNIAFSHLHCNISVAAKESMLGNQKAKRIYPEGKLWCVGCKDYHDIAMFGKNRDNHSGYAHYCIESRKLYRNKKV